MDGRDPGLPAKGRPRGPRVATGAEGAYFASSDSSTIS